MSLAIALSYSSVMSTTAFAAASTEEVMPLAEGLISQRSLSGYTPHAEQSVQIRSVNTYGPGYQATCTEKSGTSALNYVAITCNDTSYELTKEVKISEVNVTVYFDTTRTYSGDMVPFRVELMCTGGSCNSSNYGTIAINN